MWERVCVYVRESVCVRVCLLESFKFEAHEFKVLFCISGRPVPNDNKDSTSQNHIPSPVLNFPSMIKKNYYLYNLYFYQNKNHNF